MRVCEHQPSAWKETAINKSVTKGSQRREHTQMMQFKTATNYSVTKKCISDEIISSCFMHYFVKHCKNVRKERKAAC